MFAPVNESIWEHQKLLFTSVIVYGIIDYLLIKKYDVKHNNFFISLFVSAFIIVPVFLAMYLPLYFKIGQSMFMNILIMFIAIVVSQFVSYKILDTRKELYRANLLSIVSIGILFIVFSYFTYYPVKTKIFFDTKEEKYGINNYNI